MENSIQIRVKADTDVTEMTSVIMKHGFEETSRGKTRDGIYIDFDQLDYQLDFSWLQLQAEVERTNPEAEQDFAEGEREDDWLGSKETAGLTIEM